MFIRFHQALTLLTSLTKIDEAPIEDWLAVSIEGLLKAQTHFQRGGFAMTLLHLEETDGDEDGKLTDSYENFPKF